jgi:antitoxin (DNA-binding transcriptional repressor) of toxin-antitoxin stability system
MHTVSVDEAQTRLSELIREANEGEVVVIACEDGTAVQPAPVIAEGRPRFGSACGMFTMADDFDEPLEDFAAYEP